MFDSSNGMGFSRTGNTEMGIIRLQIKWILDHVQLLIKYYNYIKKQIPDIFTKESTEGNIPIYDNEGLLSDSGTRPIKICSNTYYWTAYSIVNDVHRGIVLKLPATSPVTEEYFEVDNQEILRFYVPQVNYGTTENVASTYQNNYVVVTIKDKVLNTTYNKYISAISGEETGAALKVKDIYGKLFDIELRRLSDGYLYPTVFYGLQGSDISTTSTTTTTTESIVLTKDSSTYTVTSESASSIEITAEVDSCSVVLPTTTITSNKYVTFVIPSTSKDITIGSSSYSAETTVFCVYTYDSSTSSGSWVINSTQTVSDSSSSIDYSNSTVLVASKSNINIGTLTDSYICISEVNWESITNITTGSLILLADQDDKSTVGLYEYSSGSVEGDVSSFILKKVASYSDIVTVRVKNQYDSDTDLESGLWINEYNGKDSSTVSFEQIVIKSNTHIYSLTLSNQSADYSITLNVSTLNASAISVDSLEDSTGIEWMSSMQIQKIYTGSIVTSIKIPFTVPLSGTWKFIITKKK